ncbi:MAG: hypothetical protein AB7U44_07725 [Sulfuricurvum sp.]|uniref:hypothetical protein n=1 Tax=Sulfuricurvum sp. TaxID=2025608 RepID=UPI003D0A4A67
MEYIESLLWLALWPIVIFLGYKFAKLNLRHYQKMERLEELEKIYAGETAK